MTTGTDVKARLLAHVKSEPSPSRDAASRGFLVRLALASAVSVAILIALGGAHADKRGGALVVLTALAWSAIASASSVIAMRRSKTMLGTPASLLIYAVMAVPAALAGAFCGLAGGAIFAPSPHAIGIDVTCLVATLALAAAPLVVFFHQRGDGDPVRPSATGAAIGAAAGAWGSVLIDLHCERIDVRHVAIGHLLPVVLLSLLGAALGQALLAVRLPRARP